MLPLAVPVAVYETTLQVVYRLMPYYICEKLYYDFDQDCAHCVSLVAENVIARSANMQACVVLRDAFPDRLCKTNLIGDQLMAPMPVSLQPPRSAGVGALIGSGETFAPVAAMDGHARDRVADQYR